ncbi:MAG: hypothetical protein D6755_08445, partial [Anaerolineae bacterium]
GYARYAWGVLAINFVVILWGAFVRATGSGAGCGAHWPTCNGEVIPRAPAVETLIEFIHRLTSGAALLAVIGLVVWAWRAYPKGHLVRKGAGFTMLFIITESLLGAGLVLFEWVAQDASMGRVISMPLHLVNTFLLLASITLTAWWASGGQAVRLPRGDGRLPWFALGLLAILFLGTSGAVTALGDTLFPASSLLEGMRQDFSSTAHFLIRLRVIHPLIAALSGAYLFFLVLGQTLQRKPSGAERMLARLLLGLFFLQLLAGVTNLLLLAPVWMQLVHLFLADSVWCAFVLYCAAVFGWHENAVAA